MTKTARNHLDEKFNKFTPSIPWKRPPSGWIRAIRESLSMSANQLAKLLGISRIRVNSIEQDEVKNKLKLETLERVAEALGCNLVYVLLPKKSLNLIVEQQALVKAKKILASTKHTMKLEAQGLEKADEKALLENIIQDLLTNKETQIWDE